MMFVVFPLAALFLWWAGNLIVLSQLDALAGEKEGARWKRFFSIVITLIAGVLMAIGVIL